MRTASKRRREFNSYNLEQRGIFLLQLLAIGSVAWAVLQRLAELSLSNHLPEVLR